MSAGILCQARAVLQLLPSPHLMNRHSRKSWLRKASKTLNRIKWYRARAKVSSAIMRLKAVNGNSFEKHTIL